MDRLTEKTIGCFEYDLKEHNHETGEFNTYDAFFNYNMAVRQLGKYEDANELRPIGEWGEDYGDCIWWSLPIEEPPYCGSPLDINFPDYVTHFTRLICPEESTLSDKGIEQFESKKIEYQNKLEKIGLTYDFKGGLIWE